ncbi:MAG: pyrimidine 5'-nucleotidase [bacterium]|nr:pyrimidine 5'-nucleotidase [bacterium]MDT8365194.1 pyrimidine 5'-nucleotidase [bacterium]
MNDLNLKLAAAKGILFDLDNTLYNGEKGVFQRINERINDFVREFTECKSEKVDALRRDYKDRYGTTLGGLMAHHSVDPDQYLEYVHDVSVEELLKPDPVLAAFLRSIELPMAIFTNGSNQHARRVLDALGVAPYFEGICDLADTKYLGKPHREAFEAASGLLDCSLAETVFVDDLLVNVKAGSELCSLSIHVNPWEDGAGDLHVEKVLDLVPIFSPMPWYQD